MRPALLTAALLLGVWAAGAAASMAWLDRALAAPHGRDAICLSARYRARIAAGTLPLDEQDGLVAQVLHFRQVEPRMGPRWTLREVAIYATYRTFRAEQERRGIFTRIASGLRDCPARDKHSRNGPGPPLPKPRRT